MAIDYLIVFISPKKKLVKICYHHNIVIFSFSLIITLNVFVMVVITFLKIYCLECRQ